MKERKRSKNFEKMLFESIQGGFSFYAWNSTDGLVEKCELKIKAYRKELGEIELEFKPENLKSFSNVVAGNRMLNIYIPQLSVSFASTLTSVSAERKVKISLPEEYTFHERRKHDRFKMEGSCFVYFDHNKMKIKKSLYDISLGGAAVILSKVDRVNITRGKMFSDFVLEMNGRKMRAKAECVNSVSIDRYKIDDLPYGGFKIAFRFFQLTNEDKAYLMDFVAQQTIENTLFKKAN